MITREPQLCPNDPITIYGRAEALFSITVWRLEATADEMGEYLLDGKDLGT